MQGLLFSIHLLCIIAGFHNGANGKITTDQEDNEPKGLTENDELISLAQLSSTTETTETNDQNGNGSTDPNNIQQTTEYENVPEMQRTSFDYYLKTMVTIIPSFVHFLIPQSPNGNNTILLSSTSYSKSPLDMDTNFERTFTREKYIIDELDIASGNPTGSTETETNAITETSGNDFKSILINPNNSSHPSNDPYRNDFSNVENSTVKISSSENDYQTTKVINIENKRSSIGVVSFSPINSVLSKNTLQASERTLTASDIEHRFNDKRQSTNNNSYNGIEISSRALNNDDAEATMTTNYTVFSLVNPSTGTEQTVNSTDGDNTAVTENPLNNNFSTINIATNVIQPSTTANPSDDTVRSSYEQCVEVVDKVSVKVLIGEEHGVSVADPMLASRLPMIVSRENLSAYSVDYHYDKGYLFFVGGNQMIIRLNIPIQTGLFTSTGIYKAIVKDVFGSVRIAVDWLTDTIYWMSDYSLSIEKADVDGGNRTVLFEDGYFEYPNNLAVDPYSRYLFFVSNGTIYKYTLNKKKHEEIELGNLEKTGRINCLALDIRNKTLYFSGKNFNHQSYIASSDYDGRMGFYYVLDDKWNYITSIDVFRESLFFVDDFEGEFTLNVATISNQDLSNEKTIFVPFSEESAIWGIKVFHPRVQNKTYKESCLKENSVYDYFYD